MSFHMFDKKQKLYTIKHRAFTESLTPSILGLAICV